MLVFIYTYLRPLIEAGKVYKVFSPLYRIDDKEHPFVINKAEMVEIFQKKVTKQYKVTTEYGYKLDKDEMIEFLQDTYTYASDLDRMAKNLGNVNKFLVEQIIALLTVSGYVRSGKDFDDLDKLFNDQKFIKNLMSRIQEKFPEIVVNQDTHTLKGVVNGRFCSIKINKRFIRQAEDLIPVYKKYQYKLLVSEKGKETPVFRKDSAFWDESATVRHMPG
jgi:DNA gyrase/topoisomerase IV subunit B